VTRIVLTLAIVIAAALILVKVLYGENQVTICHHPPGNPTNVQTITVGQSAVPAHLAHGDTTGACAVSPHR